MLPIQEDHPLFDRSQAMRKHLEGITHPLFESFVKLLTISQYAFNQIDIVKKIAKEDDCQHPLSRNDYFTSVKKISLTQAQPSFMRELRCFRHFHCTCIYSTLLY